MTEQDKQRRYRDWGRQTLEDEATAILGYVRRMDASFSSAVQMLCACRGRVVLCGLGKSGHVGRKIAATLSSLGTPAIFVHAAEALHGDLGMFVPGDVAIAISNSGETSEVVATAEALKGQKIKVIAMTRAPQSRLGRLANIVLDISVPGEADPWNLAPTASSTLTLALGDALAVAAARAKHFTPADFARRHPGGALGRKSGARRRSGV